MAVLMMSIVFYGCSVKSFDDEIALLEYVNDDANGYTLRKSINGIDYTLTYRPTDILVNQELKSTDSVDINRLRDKYSKYLYFNLSMSKNNKDLLSAIPKNRNEFGAMANELLFGMKNKVHLITNKNDTIEMIDYNYPRMYGMSKATTMMFIYPRDPQYINEDYLSFTVEDLGLHTGEVNFMIMTNKIKNEPTLSFK
ncbi:hypothetical protein E5167_05440 [Pontimicrobium aquaticum]|uniref:Uncharacterized protein n=2 Tax=Pontimicrobium aquaticum TaxID=2565367 RepID=A0A4U0EZD0_9FLAO|nr:hypothetical protein E5167_05440 [Pontimicrobium aquaticum]